MIIAVVAVGIIEKDKEVYPKPEQPHGWETDVQEDVSPIPHTRRVPGYPHTFCCVANSSTISRDSEILIASAVKCNLGKLFVL